MVMLLLHYKAVINHTMIRHPMIITAILMKPTTLIFLYKTML